MKFKLLSLLVLLVPMMAGAESCADLQIAYSNQDKEIAAIRDSGSFDNSAPREALRQARVGNAIARKQLILQFMGMQKCALPKVVEESYQSSATICGLDPKSEKHCDRKSWMPDSDSRKTK